MDFNLNLKYLNIYIVVSNFLEDKKTMPIFVKYRIFSIHSSDVYM